MLKRSSSRVLTILVTAVSAAAMLAAAGCASGVAADQAGAQQGSQASATQLASLTAGGLHLDYDHLASPKAAVAASESIIRGTLVDVTDGLTLKGANAAQAGRRTPYATFVIQVGTALKGAAPNTKVYVQVNKASISNVRDLAKAGTGLEVVAVLDDISGWTPAAGVTVVRPAGVAATGPLFLAFPDGLWLQGGADRTMTGVHAEPAELTTAWGAPRTLSQYWTSLEKAAR